MNIKEENLNDTWTVYVLKSDQGMEVHVLNYGGVITKIMTPDRNGKIENVVLGYRNTDDYVSNPHFLGATIGRVAGRIKNASLSIDGKLYKLEANDGRNHLHSGTNGFHHVIWDAEPFELDDSVGVKLRYFSQDGENGYPGNVKVAVTYTLTNDNELVLDYWAYTDQTTPLALTNHSYFNLSGNLRDTVHGHQVTVDSQQFVELDAELIATGKRVNVEETSFDFRQGRKLEDGIIAGNKQNKIVGNGYDHYFIFNDHNKEESVTVKDESSGRVLTIETDQPGMVMYTANNLEAGLALLEGASKKYLGVCFETQASPASLHEKDFPGVMLEGGEEYQKQTVFRFGAE
ncbi:aldose epimerase family protein [Lentibacillus juripiscarius]|uniref:Aldose 1-epimerase n=1 Tax=Lentibacillus juripiscarius TaxID=257446 RepID=A0ABW5V265_9BACI